MDYIKEFYEIKNFAPYLSNNQIKDFIFKHCLEWYNSKEFYEAQKQLKHIN